MLYDNVIWRGYGRKIIDYFGKYFAGCYGGIF